MLLVMRFMVCHGTGSGAVQVKENIEEVRRWSELEYYLQCFCFNFFQCSFTFERERDRV